MHIYTEQFYEDQSTGSLRSAKRVVPIIVNLLSPKSVVDIGSGIGTWLSVFSEHGVEKVLGIDGPYVDRDKLLISPDSFLAADLNQLPQIQREFDLAICLEVAEHLPDSSSDALVDTLTSLGKFVLFSAAIPFQGGEHHINEQWPNYWSKKFINNGFVPVDFLRFNLWEDEDIEFWYRQNLILFVRTDIVNSYHFPEATINKMPSSLVHPEQYLQKCYALSTQEKQINAQSELVAQLRKRIEDIKDPGQCSPWDAFISFLNTIRK